MRVGVVVRVGVGVGSGSGSGSESGSAAISFHKKILFSNLLWGPPLLVACRSFVKPVRPERSRKARKPYKASCCPEQSP